MTNNKERTTVTLDPEVAAYLGKDGVNGSGTVNEAVKQYMGGGGGDAMRQLRITQLESEIDELEARKQRKIEELEHLRSLEEEQADAFEDRLLEAYDSLVDLEWTEDNQALRGWAADLDLEPDELIEELERIDADVENGGDAQ